MALSVLSSVERERERYGVEEKGSEVSREGGCRYNHYDETSEGKFF